MKIFTDSTADLTPDLYEKYNVGMVPLTIQMGHKQWRDAIDIQPSEFYTMLRESSDISITSQPSPQEFIKAYTPFVEKGEPILSLHISSKLSGTYQSATLAKNNFPDAKIEVIDSKQACLGLGLMLALCAERVRLGWSFEDISEFARKLSMKVDTYFSVDNLEYLRRGGRIGIAKTLLGNLMKIKPLMRLVDGAIHPVEKIRTTERLLNRFVELVEKAAQESQSVSFVVAETDNSDIVTSLLERLWRISNARFIHRCKLGGVIASHTGPGAIAVTFVNEE